MLQDQDDGLPTPPTVSTLKRHEPPSPSSSSSPKRAASEDATSALSSADAPTASSLLPHLAPPLYPSSPLRMDCDDEAESTGWVDRTGQVSLGSEDDATTPGGDGSKRGELREVYDAVLGRLESRCRVDNRLRAPAIHHRRSVLPASKTILQQPQELCVLR